MEEEVHGILGAFQCANIPGQGAEGIRHKPMLLEQPITSREAGAILGRHYKTIERAARNGEIPAYFKFGRWYFFKTELYEWLRSGLHSGSQSRRVN